MLWKTMEWYQEQKVFYSIEVGPKRGVIHPVGKITQPGGSEVHPSSKALEQETHVDARDPSSKALEQETHVDASSPLEQFEIIPFFPMKIGDLYFSFINPSLFMLLTLSSVWSYFCFILLLKRAEFHLLIKFGNVVSDILQTLDLELNHGILSKSCGTNDSIRKSNYQLLHEFSSG